MKRIICNCDLCSKEVTELFVISAGVKEFDSIWEKEVCKDCLGKCKLYIEEYFKLDIISGESQTKNERFKNLIFVLTEAIKKSSKELYDRGLSYRRNILTNDYNFNTAVDQITKDFIEAIPS